MLGVSLTVMLKVNFSKPVLNTRSIRAHRCSIGLRKDIESKKELI